MNEHVEARLGATGPDGYIQPSGLAGLKALLSTPGAAALFHTWKDQRFTQLIASAVADLATNQPISVTKSDDYLVQYGITQGLNMALRLLQDPSILLPGVFGSPPGEKPLQTKIPDENFDTPADGGVDN